MSGGVAGLGVTSSAWEAIESSPLTNFSEYKEMVSAIQTFVTARKRQLVFDSQGRRIKSSGSREQDLYARLTKMLYEATLAGNDAKGRKDLQRVYLWYCFQRQTFPPGTATVGNGGKQTTAAALSSSVSSTAERSKHGGVEVSIANTTTTSPRNDFAVRFLSSSLESTAESGGKTVRPSTTTATTATPASLSAGAEAAEAAEAATAAHSPQTPEATIMGGSDGALPSNKEQSLVAATDEQAGNNSAGSSPIARAKGSISKTNSAAVGGAIDSTAVSASTTSTVSPLLYGAGALDTLHAQRQHWRGLRRMKSAPSVGWTSGRTGMDGSLLETEWQDLNRTGGLASSTWYSAQQSQTQAQSHDYSRTMGNFDNDLNLSSPSVLSHMAASISMANSNHEPLERGRHLSSERNYAATASSTTTTTTTTTLPLPLPSSRGAYPRPGSSMGRPQMTPGQRRFEQNLVATVTGRLLAVSPDQRHYQQQQQQYRASTAGSSNGMRKTKSTGALPVATTARGRRRGTAADTSATSSSSARTANHKKQNRSPGHYTVHFTKTAPPHPATSDLSNSATQRASLLRGGAHGPVSSSSTTSAAISTTSAQSVSSISPSSSFRSSSLPSSPTKFYSRSTPSPTQPEHPRTLISHTSPQQGSGISPTISMSRRGHRAGAFSDGPPPAYSSGAGGLASISKTMSNVQLREHGGGGSSGESRGKGSINGNGRSTNNQGRTSLPIRVPTKTVNLMSGWEIETAVARATRPRETVGRYKWASDGIQGATHVKVLKAPTKMPKSPPTQPSKTLQRTQPPNVADLEQFVRVDFLQPAIAAQWQEAVRRDRRGSLAVASPMMSAQILRDEARRDMAATVIQSMWRGYKDRVTQRKRRQSVVVIQGQFRLFLARRAHARAETRRRNSAITIQRNVRAFLQRKADSAAAERKREQEQQEKLKLEEKEARKIRKMGLQVATERDRRKAALQLQRHWRGHMARLKNKDKVATARKRAEMNLKDHEYRKRIHELKHRAVLRSKETEIREKQYRINAAELRRLREGSKTKIDDHGQVVPNSTYKIPKFEDTRHSAGCGTTRKEYSSGADAAAALIQAAYRGHSHRKSMANLRAAGHLTRDSQTLREYHKARADSHSSLERAGRGPRIEALHMRHVERFVEMRDTFDDVFATHASSESEGEGESEGESGDGDGGSSKRKSMAFTTIVRIVNEHDNLRRAIGHRRVTLAMLKNAVVHSTSNSAETLAPKTAEAAADGKYNNSDENGGIGVSLGRVRLSQSELHSIMFHLRPVPGIRVAADYVSTWVRPTVDGEDVLEVAEQVGAGSELESASFEKAFALVKETKEAEQNELGGPRLNPLKADLADFISSGSEGEGEGDIGDGQLVVGVASRQSDSPTSDIEGVSDIQPADAEVVAQALVDGSVV